MISMAATRSLRLGTRGSALALRQAEIIRDEISRAHPTLHIDTEIIRTTGDEPLLAVSEADDTQILSPVEGSFVHAIEVALLEGRIDFAVHSFKDMPSADPPGLTIAAMPPRADARDILVSSDGTRLQDLRVGARIGTGSPRRRAALLSIRPDLSVEPIRGNVDTRLRKVVEGAFDGVILAAAGLERLGRESEVSEYLDPDIFIPAIGQGILAVQARTNDAETVRLLSGLEDKSTRACAIAERAVAVAIQAGCNTPVAAHARIHDGHLHLIAFLLHADGSTLAPAEAAGSMEDARQLGAQVARSLLARSGRTV
jgi:hydroxymethylbilane synthase